MNPAVILHVDMDAFYASVEIRDRPELRERPVIVGGTPDGRGVVAAANYEARKFGIHSAMPTATALRRCPHLICLPVRMSVYAEVSQQIRAILERFTPVIEPLSLDEAFLDVAGSVHLFGSAEQIASRIRQALREELRLTASVGVAPIKFVAKIASDLHKPDALVVVPPDSVREFLDPLPVSRLWGVGQVAGRTLETLGIRTVGQLRQFPCELLVERFGKSGQHLWELAQGIDPRRVVPDHQARSISHETTFAQDIADLTTLSHWLLELTDQVARRLRRQKLCARSVHLKLRGSSFRTVTRSRTMPVASCLTDDLWQTASELLHTGLPEGLLPLRLLGMGVSGLEHGKPQQGLLFDADQRKQQARADKVGDAIRQRFGTAALRRAAVVREDRERPNEPPPPAEER